MGRGFPGNDGLCPDCEVRKFVLILLCLLPCFSLGAQETVLSRLKEANFPDSLSADFTLTRHSPMLASDLVSKGRVNLAKPDYIRWEVISPKPSVTVFSGEDASSNRRFRLPSDRDFKVSTLEGTELSIILEPVRGDMKRLFEKIVVKVNPKTYIVHTVLLQGFDGDSTFIEFDHIKQ